jgi:hypothetical protein
MVFKKQKIIFLIEKQFFAIQKRRRKINLVSPSQILTIMVSITMSLAKAHFSNASSTTNLR